MAGTSLAAPKPWPHQERLARAFFESDKREFVASICPGGGKTDGGLMVAAVARQRYGVERVFVVGPSQEVKRQWIGRGLSYGIPLSDWSRRRDTNHYVATYSAIAEDPEAVAALVNEGRTLVLFDEIHHASKEKLWGISSHIAFDGAWRSLSLTGTPFRSDGEGIHSFSYGLQGTCEPDFRYLSLPFAKSPVPSESPSPAWANPSDPLSHQPRTTARRASKMDSLNLRYLRFLSGGDHGTRLCVKPAPAPNLDGSLLLSIFPFGGRPELAITAELNGIQVRALHRSLSQIIASTTLPERDSLGNKGPEEVGDV